MPQPPLSRRRTTDGDDSLGGLVVRRDMEVVGMSMGWCGRHGQARLQTGQRIATRPPRTRPRARRRSGGGCSGSGSGSGSTRVACSAQHCIATTWGSAQPQAVDSPALIERDSQHGWTEDFPVTTCNQSATVFNALFGGFQQRLASMAMFEAAQLAGSQFRPRRWKPLASHAEGQSHFRPGKMLDPNTAKSFLALAKHAC